MENKKEKKEKMKALREERAEFVGNAREHIKTTNKIFKKIKSVIKDKAMTIPEIASAIKEPASKVLIYVSGLKKFGMAVEAAKDGDYYKYKLSLTD